MWVSCRSECSTVNSSSAFGLAVDLCINCFGSFPCEIKYTYIRMTQYCLSLSSLETYSWVGHEQKQQLCL